MEALGSDSIYNILEEEIISLRIKPGEALSENDLCARFGVSRTPIRSVLQRLAGIGLVNITPYKSTVVTRIDYNIVNQTIYQRVAVESMVVRNFMALCTPMLIEKLRYLIRSSRVLLEQEDFSSSQFYALDSQLHAVWFAETKKEYLWECIQKAQSNYSRFRMLDIVENKILGYEQIVAEHEQLLDILVRRDAAAIEALFVQHLYGGVMRLGDRIYTDLQSYFVQN